jgi:pyridoxamine 5'-phosphate oxidase
VRSSIVFVVAILGQGNGGGGYARAVDADDLDADPLRQFERWFAEAGAGGVAVPEAMTLATATADGRPSARMVLLKAADERGFAFYTNLESRKARELAENPRAALHFHWRAPAGRQVRVEGAVERVAAEEAEAYFRTRPPGSRIAAWASPQSRPLGSREELERLVEDAIAAHGPEPPLPPHWGGYRVVPDAYEFWQHGDDRLHDRVRYERDGAGWRRTRLAP